MGLGDRHGSHTWPEAAVRALAFILPAAGSQTGRVSDVSQVPVLTDYSSCRRDPGGGRSSG